MKVVRSNVLKGVIKTLEKIADAKINQGVLLKELAHSIRANQKEKTPQEWKDWVNNHLKEMLNAEKEILEVEK